MGSLRTEIHSHSHFSNLRLLDATIRPKELVDRAIELGLAGVALTDHETLSGHMEINDYAQEVLKEHPDFKVILGNEIYLCNDRSMGQEYYHFILLAKNALGHKALRELSSNSWLNSYHDRGMERVVTTYDDLAVIVEKYPNSLIASSACLGGYLSSSTAELIRAERVGDEAAAQTAHNNIVNFILYCKKLFGEDFYVECAPGHSKEQIQVNQRLVSIAQCFQVKMVVGTDAHYLKKEDRYVHKAFLNSKGGEREVDSFYEDTYLQSNEEIIEILKLSNFDSLFVEQMFQNSMEIWNKIENYSLAHNQTIPSVEVPNYPAFEDNSLKEYPNLYELKKSDNDIKRYWVNECLLSLKEKIKEGKVPQEQEDIYLKQLEKEADIKRTVGEHLGTNIFAYPVVLKHYIDLIWKCGSTIGAGRGSAGAGLNHWLLGITQSDPVKLKLPFERYMNWDTTGLPEI